MTKSIFAIGLQKNNSDESFRTFDLYSDVVYLRRPYNTEIDGDRERAIGDIKKDASIFIGQNDQNQLGKWIFIDGDQMSMEMKLEIK